MTGESRAPAIGIDLGTTYSCAAVWRKGRVEIIPNDQGNRTTPSCVSFKGHECLVGESAMSAAASNPANTVFEFNVVWGRDDKPMISIIDALGDRRYSPEDISAMILIKMKAIAEAYLGSSVRDAVIAVPAHFSFLQRRATKEAGILSGLNVLRLVAELTAAAIAYGLDKEPTDGERNVLVFDLGGGTFDVSLLAMSGDEMKVRSTAGDAHLGGVDFDNRMVGHFVEELMRKHGRDVSGSPRALRRLKAACERAKRVLSFAESTVVEIDALYDGFDFESEMSRAEFEELNADLFEKCIGLVERCLEDGSTDKSSVDDVVLAGGSTRIPKVQELLRGFFDGKELRKNVHPDEAVASGAAILAAGAFSSGQCTFEDVTPLSLGVGVVADKMIPVVPRNTAFPAKIERVFSTCVDDQTSVLFDLYEGERPRTRDNVYLGRLTLRGIPRAPRGVEKFDVCFEIDADGVLNVSAVIRSTGKKRSLEIGYVDLPVPEHEVDRMLEDAERCKSEDERDRERFVVGRSLARYVYKTRDAVLAKRGAAHDFELPDRATKKIRDEIRSSIEWLEANEFAEADVLSNKRRELESKWNPFLNALSSLLNY